MKYSIFFIILLFICTAPFFSPNGIYIIYQQIKGKIHSNSKLRLYRKEFFIGTLFSGSIITIVLLLLLSVEGLSPCSIMLFFLLLTLLIKGFMPAICSLLNCSNSIKEELPRKIKKINVLFHFITIIIAVTVSIYSVKISNKLENVIINTAIPISLENYANDNNYMIFQEKNTIINDENYIINDNQTCYFNFNRNDNSTIVYNKLSPQDSFETVYDNLLYINNKELMKNYSDILDNLYYSLNYRRMCYLLNEDNIISVYGLIQKDKNTNKFYISKYVLFNMETGELSDLP